MPELPEVELLRIGLHTYIHGLTIHAVEVRQPTVFSGHTTSVVGGTVQVIRRYGKMLSIDLSNGNSLAIHVKMTGRLIYRGRKQPKKLDVDPDLSDLPGKHTHVIFRFTNGDVLYFNDVRRFGWVKVVPSKLVESLAFVAKLGPEPFRDLNLSRFTVILSASKRSIKTLLMDQSRISGVGNIYANEALHCAKILPERTSSTITSGEAKKLFTCIERVLEDGLKHGGSSTDSFRDVLGRRGSFQTRYMVYDREDQKCRRRGCSGRIKKVKLSGRGTYFCIVCQH